MRAKITVTFEQVWLVRNIPSSISSCWPPEESVLASRPSWRRTAEKKEGRFQKYLTTTLGRKHLIIQFKDQPCKFYFYLIDIFCLLGRENCDKVKMWYVFKKIPLLAIFRKSCARAKKIPLFSRCR